MTIALGKSEPNRKKIEPAASFSNGNKEENQNRPQKQRKTECSLSNLDRKNRSTISVEKKTSGLSELGETAGIDKSSARRMQRGQVQIEDRLDLHGLSQEQAHKQLKAFISQGVQKNFRHVSDYYRKGP